MNNMESRIPRKKAFKKTLANRTVRNVRYNSNGDIVAVEDESDEDRKMPARKHKKRVANPVDSDSSDESVADNKTSKEERAFLKAIQKEEKSNNESSGEDSE